MKAWLKGVRVRYARMVHPFGPGDVKRGLIEVGVVPGDILMVHSSFDSFAGFRGTPAQIIRTLQDVVGPAGTVLMPTLPFSGSERMALISLSATHSVLPSVVRPLGWAKEASDNSPSPRSSAPLPA